MSPPTRLISTLVSTMKNSKTNKYLDIPSTPDDSEEEHFLPSKESARSPGSVGGEESGHSYQRPSVHRSGWFSFFLVTCSATTLGLLAMLLTLAQYRRPTDLVSNWHEYQGGSKVLDHCGNSPEEAIELGCVWDLMSFGWIHPSCYNPTESQKWIQKYGPWDWYYDLNATQPIPANNLTSTPMVYTSQGYHVVHCLYILKTLHLAGMSGHIVTDEAIPLAHTQHCIDMISSPKYTDFAHINTKVYMLFARCVTLD